MYSLGVIFYMMAIGKSPFEGKDQKELERKNEISDINWQLFNQ